MPSIDITNIITFPEFTVDSGDGGLWVVGMNQGQTYEVIYQLSALSHTFFKDIGTYTHDQLDYVTSELSATKPTYDSVYTTVLANSALWTPDGNIDYPVRSLTANWEITYTEYSSNSSNYNSTYTTVQNNSAQWADNRDLEVRGLTGNWDEWTETYSVVSSTSANWNSNYTTVNSNSSNWGNPDLSEIESLSSNWQETYTEYSSNSSNYDSNYTTVQNNSALWNPDGNIDYPVRGLTANWEDTFTEYSSNSGEYSEIDTVVKTNSADWADHRDLEVRGLTGFWDEWTETYSVVSSTSADWNSNYTTVNSNSADWATVDLSEIEALSSNWQETYTTVESNSALWSPDGNIDYPVRALTANWESTYTTVESNSSQWAIDTDTIYDDTLLAATSGDWNSNYTTVNSNSATWAGNFCDDIVYINQLSSCSNNTISVSSNINLNDNSISQIHYLDFHQDDTLAPQEARLHWNDEDGTLDLGLKGSNVNLQIGMEQVIRVKANENIANGQVVYIDGATGITPKISIATNTSLEQSHSVIGVATEDININQFGYITVQGMVRDIDTTNIPTGEIAYLGTNGSILSSAPVPPDHEVKVGYCVISHATTGKLYVNINLGYDIDDIDDILILNPQTNDTLLYNSVSGLWENKTSNNWQSTYTTVNSNSSQWAIDTIYDDTLLAATSGDWNSNYTTVNSNSSQWAIDTIYDDTLLAATSGDWNSVYNSVLTNSATWVPDGNIDFEVRNLSANWQDTFTEYSNSSALYNEIDTVVQNNSAAWAVDTDTIYDDTLLQSASGDWNNAQIVVETNSAAWIIDNDTIYDDTLLQSASSDWDSNYTTTFNNSADWANHTDITLIQNASGGWSSTETTVSVNSAAWADTDHTNLSNIGTNTHAQIDSHISNSSNPHATSDANLLTTDITTNNSSTTKHGFLPKLPGNSSQYLDGNGNYTTPSGVANAYKTQSFASVSSINVNHQFKGYPIVQIILSAGNVTIPHTITHNSIDDFTVTFTSPQTGTILATLGSPQLNNYTTATGNYSATSGDYLIRSTGVGSTISLPATSLEAHTYVIKNTSGGNISVIALSTTTIDDSIDDLILLNLESVSIFSDGSNYYIT